LVPNERVIWTVDEGGIQERLDAVKVELVGVDGGNKSRKIAEEVVATPTRGEQT
jgi:hypothetical protein